MTNTYTYKRPPKSPAAAGILSGLCPGIGQIYNGEYLKGILFLVIFAGIVTIIPRGHQPFIPLLMAGFYVFQIIEAVQAAGAINRKALGQNGAPAEAAGTAVPETAKPSSPGLVFWGILLMALGVVFLLGNFNVIEYDRLFDLWPLVVIAIGIKFIADYFRKKNS